MISAALEYSKSHLSPSRLSHSLGVAECARRLAGRFGADPEKAALSGILHDIARDVPPRDLLQRARAEGIMVRSIDRDRPILLHGRVAAHMARGLGVNDQEVLDAISWHATGRPGWTRLEQVVFLADKIEPGRLYPGVREVRKIVDLGDLRGALREALFNSILYAARVEAGLVDPETVVVLNEVTKSIAEARLP